MEKIKGLLDYYTIQCAELDNAREFFKDPEDMEELLRGRAEVARQYAKAIESWGALAEALADAGLVGLTPRCPREDAGF